ncbi:hypothetical protein V1512DRAFT_248190 [Lipomyces arxii]|uniref:uncharacterized protein n=1 Tax=Lipomyces arxii TaxID=56418 RepID=UPI0034CEBB46
MPPRHFVNRKGPPQLSGSTTSNNASSYPSFGSVATSDNATKSSFERAKEAEEARRRRDEDETRAAYEDFVKSFEGDTPEVNFVQSGTALTNQQSYPTHTTTVKRSFPFTGQRSRNDTTGIKRRVLDRPAGLPRPDQIRNTVSNYTEPSAASMYIGGLLPNSTQSSVTKLVSKYGKVQTVVLQLPDPKRRGISARVVFEDAEDVEKARVALDRQYLGSGYWLSASHGKDAGPTSRLDARSGLPFGAQLPADLDLDSTVPGFAPPSSVGLSTSTAHNLLANRLHVQVRYPDSLLTLRKIHGMIENILKLGPEFEAVIRVRERYNADYAFLFDSALPEHIYFRWKFWSLASGEAIDKWSTKPIEMFSNGILWVPPSLAPSIEQEIAQVDNEDVDRAEQPEHKLSPWLGPLAHLHLTLLLQHISPKRGSIARLMAFAIDNSHAAEEIVEVMCNSVVGPDAPAQLRVARLWAIGDVLYNSGMGIGGVNKGVWKYRSLFQSRLVSVFVNLHEVFRAFDGRIRADNFRRQVLAVLNVWEGWSVFTHEALEEMTYKFLGSEIEPANEISHRIDEEGQEPRPVKVATFNKWKKIDSSTATRPNITDSEFNGANKKAGGAIVVNVNDLIDPELDGEPLTDSEDDEPIVSLKTDNDV